MKAGGIKTWKELTIGVQQLLRLFLAIILSTLGLSFKNAGEELKGTGVFDARFFSIIHLIFNFEFYF